MRPRIAIPLPISTDPEYVERALPQYEDAIRMAGGEPVRVPLDRTPNELTRIIESCDGVLLPGSGADVDPAKYNAGKHEKTAPADPKRDAVDELLLKHAYEHRKPILGICYGLQSLNVHCRGSLVQHIPDFLAREDQNVNHAAGRKEKIAHEVAVDPASKLASIVGSKVVPVNSSHHQAADKPGAGLRVVAQSTADGIIEALEGTAPDHFVMAVQWHPERSVEDDESSRAIFRALVEASLAKKSAAGK